MRVFINPKISVIIPVYNVEKYLDECVHSVLKQDYQDYEIILVNDGSTDNSGKKCDVYAEEYSQIKVVHKENGGLSDARNFGIKEASGDYLIFLDSDDFWQGKNRLSEISSIIENQNEPDIIFYGMTPFFYGQADIKLNTFPVFSQTQLTNDFQKDFGFLTRNFIYKATGCDKIIKRKIIINNQLFFPKGRLHEDVAWCYDIIQYINTYSIYPQSFYCYRRGREGSITYNISEKSVMDIIDMVYERAENEKSKSSKNEFLFLWGYIIIIIIINKLSKENFEKYFPKVKKMSFLFNYTLKNIPIKQKVRLLAYKILGIKFAGKLEYKLRKALNKL